MSERRAKARIVGVRNHVDSSRGLGRARRALTIELDVFDPEAFDATDFPRELEIVMPPTLGEIAHDAYRQQADTDGRGTMGYSSYDTMPPHAQKRWDAAAAAVAKAASGR